MKKTFWISGVVVALAGIMVLLAPDAKAQQRRPFAATPPVLTLEAPGSSIGISARDTKTDETARAGTPGVVVQDVREGSPAFRAGLQQNDVVVEFDGERVRSMRQFTRLARETAPGRAVKITVVRDGSRQALDITPESRSPADVVRLPNIAADLQRERRARPRDFPFDFDFDFAPPFVGVFPRRQLGLTVTPLTDQLATYFGVKQGVLVSDVGADSPAAAAGVKAGDVVTSINGQPMSAPSDARSALREAQPGSSVEIRVMRDRKEVTLTAKLPERERPVPGSGQPI